MNRIGLSCAALLVTGATHAHVALDQPQAAAGSIYKAAVRVGHGCDGTATHTVTVRLPAGFRGAKPIPKAGWAIIIRHETLAEPYDSHGRKVTEDVVEITWKAGTKESWLADAHYDEFVVRGQLPAKPGLLWFKVQQLCEKGIWDWADVPTSGTSTKGLKAPAALLEVLPAAQSEHRH